MTTNGKCQSCGSDQISTFYEVKGVPVNSVLLMKTRKEALTYPKGDVILGFCANCGFISNLAFDPQALEYSQRYEETQSFSPTYGAFAHRLAAHLISRYDLHGQEVIEIGCGKGEFLHLLCEMGGNRGVGFDPSYVPGRIDGKPHVTFINDFYSEKYADYHADFICCRMTLEHIQETGEFVRTVRRAIGHDKRTVVFFQIPNVAEILHNLAFWDIYYEHCSYFSRVSLATLFRSCQFDILDVWTDYDDQYLMIEAIPGQRNADDPIHRRDEVQALSREIIKFSRGSHSRIEAWKQRLREIKRGNRRAVIWGSGSKGVAFLTTLGVEDEIEYVVDVNPHRAGTYMAGSGQLIVSPEFLKEYRPDVVIVMNPIYRDEIAGTLDQMELRPEITTVERGC
jgi:SAM-dependent methyltransferase